MEYIIVFRNSKPSRHRKWSALEKTYTDKAEAAAQAKKCNEDFGTAWEYRVATVEV